MSSVRSGGAGAADRDRRASLLRSLAAVAVIAGALFFALSSPVRLGLDLRGGTQIVLETRDTGTVVADALVRLADGRLGRCERCGSGIDDELVLARPLTRTCRRCDQ